MNHPLTFSRKKTINDDNNETKRRDEKVENEGHTRLITVCGVMMMLQEMGNHKRTPLSHPPTHTDTHTNLCFVCVCVQL